MQKIRLKYTKNEIFNFFVNAISMMFFMSVTYRIIFYKFSFLSQFLLFLFFAIGFIYTLKNIINSPQLVKKLVLFYFVFSSILLLYSIIYQENDPILAIRFYVILFFLVLVFFYPVNKKIVDIFLFVLFFQAIFVICFEIYMIMFYDISNYSPVRFMIQEMAIGDVYTYDGKFWRIQLAGNHLLPLALFISIYYFGGKKRIFMAMLFLLASIFSGHFAFLIAIGIFFVLYYFSSIRLTYNKLVNTICTIVIAGILFYIFVLDSVANTLERKELSLGTRYDQVSVLIDDMSNLYMDFLLGKGYGNTVEIVTNSRDYRGKVYYELQSLYIFNQVGILMFLYFVFLHSYLFCIKIKNIKIFIVYCSFILYAATNPYIFDSVHVFLIATLMSLFLNNQKME